MKDQRAAASCMEEWAAGILVKQRQFLNQRIVFGGLMSLYIRHFSNNIKSPGELYFDRRENTPPWVYSHGIISAMFYHKVFGETSLSGEINMGRLYYVYTGLFSANLYSSWRHSHKWNLFFIAFNKSMVSECVFKRFAMLFCNGSYTLNYQIARSLICALTTCRQWCTTVPW